MQTDEPDKDATLLPESMATHCQLNDTESLANLNTLSGLPPLNSPIHSVTRVLPDAVGGGLGDSDSETAGRVHREAARRFRILRPHAQGGLGKVSVARDLELNREVAFKEIRVQYADDESARARFLLEAEVTGGLEHPSIVPVYGMGCFSDGRPYYAMRFIKGQSLQEVVDHYHHASTQGAETANERSVELRGLLQRFIAVCHAIEYAHSRGIVHRDIKPANIMLGSYGETLVVDWGLAKPLGREEVLPQKDRSAESTTVDWLLPASGSSVEPTRMGATIGTLQFMGPEQAAGRIDLMGPPADIYSLGATLYYILTGRASVIGKTVGEVLRAIESGNIAPPSAVLPGIPKSLDAVCLKAMALQPDDRYESARAMAKDLERWLADEPVSVHTESTSDRVARWLRRNRAWFRAVTLSAVAIIVVLLIAIVLINRQRNIANHQRELAENLTIEKTELALRETELRKKAQWQAASRSFERNLLRCEQHDPAEAILSLVENLKEAKSIEAADLEYSVRTQLGRWQGALNTLDSTTVLNDAIRGLLLSPDGNKMLVSTNGPTTLMDLATGKMLGAPLPHEKRITAATFCPKTDRFITASEDQTIRFWDASTCEPLGDPISMNAAVVALSLTSDERVLATASGSVIRLWDAESKSFNEENLTHSEAITDIAFRPDSSLLLVCDWKGQVNLWNIETRQIVDVPWEHGSAVLDIAISPDGKTAATCELNHRAQLWEISTGKQLGKPLMHTGMVGHASFSTDGSRLITGCTDQLARVWDVATGELLGSTLHHGSIVNAATFNLDGQFIWTGCGDHGLRRWQVANGRSTNLTLGNNGNVVAAKFDNASDSLLTLSGAVVAGTFALPGELRNLKLLDETLLRDPVLSNDWLESAAFSFDGKLVAVASGEHEVQVWSVSSGELALPAFELASAVKCLAFSNDQSMLLAGTAAGDVHIWNLVTGKALGPPIHLDQRISACAFFPSNDRFMVGGWDEKVRIYRVDRGSENRLVELEHDSLITSVGPNLAGTMYFTCTANGSIRLWDAQTHQQIGLVMKYESRVKNAIFTSDGGSIFAGYFDGSIRQWDIRTQTEMGPPLWQSKEIMAIDISADGERLATACADWTIKLWDVGAASGTPEMVQRRFERLTNMEQLSDGSLRVLTTEQWQQRE